MEYTTDGVCCKYHNDAPLINDDRTADMICSECGLVVDRTIDTGCEWRTSIEHEETQNRNRVGGPENPLLTEANLETFTVVPSSQQSSSNQLSRSGTKRLITSSEQALIKAYDEIYSMGARISLTQSIIDRAKFLYRKIHSNRGISRTVLAKCGACLLIACRQEGVPRTFKEISATNDLSVKDIGRSYKKVTRLLDCNVDCIVSDDVISRFCGNIGLPNIVKKKAIDISRQAKEKQVAINKSPISIAAASIYFACEIVKHEVEIKDISDVTGVSSSTIKNTKKILLSEYQRLFPSDFEFLGRI
ncbi:transcription initiation factor IIB-like [Teleopsis dalmanni]|uniref:transcription initiation factor IIB-like n=1 Tax=Teleopsis dalmanni TaxID=139649 RepID=UPI0018CCD0AB|nr:transcription initiation factor IIB-like [Teleopsis dalmanni]XP_037951133.1 transcription initiation factor IIB-like [Teleopsis dalmanni]